MDENVAEEMQRLKDLAIYGIHITKDGKRLDPMDFYVQPPEAEELEHG